MEKQNVLAGLKEAKERQIIKNRQVDTDREKYHDFVGYVVENAEIGDRVDGIASRSVGILLKEYATLHIWNKERVQRYVALAFNITAEELDDPEVRSIILARLINL